MANKDGLSDGLFVYRSGLTIKCWLLAKKNGSISEPPTIREIILVQVVKCNLWKTQVFLERD